MRLFKDLFPLLLAKDEPMYGYIAQGYWCDVGHLDAYREAQYDALDGRVNLDCAYKEVSHEVMGRSKYLHRPNGCD